MKKFNIISKVFVMLLVALQFNNVSAKTLNESNIEALAEKIIKSESGINYMAVQSFNAMSLMSSFGAMSDNEQLMAKQRIENFGKLTIDEFTPELKEEFAKLRGFYDYDSYQNIRDMRTTSFQRLVSDFPEINTISLSDRVLLFETVAAKFDYSIFNSPEFAFESYATCIGKAIGTWASCLLPGASSLVLRLFVGCLVATEVAETAATDGAAQAAAPAVAAADATLCAGLLGLTVTDLTTCSTAFCIRVNQCK